MSRIRPKQIQLNAQWDLVVGGAGPGFGGVVLPIGSNNQALQVNSGSLQYDWINSLRENVFGGLVLEAQGPITAVNFVRVQSSSTTQPLVISAQGSDTNINLNINAKGTGRVVISSNQYPNVTAPAFSIIASQNTPGVLNLVTIPNAANDRLVAYDTVTNSIVWLTVTDVLNKIGGVFNVINLSAQSTGSHSGTQPLEGLNSYDLSFIASEGIGFVSNNTVTPQELLFRLSINTLNQTTNLNLVNISTDSIAYYNQTAQNHQRLTFAQLKTLLANTINVLTSNYTVNATTDVGTLFVINTNTQVTLTLPPTPTPGFSIKVCNVSNTYTHVVNRNGNLLNGQASNLVIDVDYEIIEFIFISNAIGWIYN